MLQRKKGAASERLLRILADETASQQERVDAQYDLNQAKDAWKAFQEATEVEEAEKAPTKIHTLVPKELPAFQIKGGPTRDKSKKVHDSVRAFIGAFEVQLGAYNLVPIDDHWERLFLLTCDETQHQWFARTLTNRQLTWSQVCACLEKEFGNPFYLWSKKDEYHQLVQRPDESVRMYLERYQEAAYEAILKQDQELVYTFVCSLQPKTKKRAWSTLTNHYGLALTSDIHQAAQLIMASSAEYVPGHTCQEYRDAKKKQYTANRAERVVMEDPDDHLPVNMGNLAIQENGKRLACIPNTPKTDEIVVPILLKNKREWALVDTGANKSFLNPALAEELGLSVITR
ncbi:unnamed protein product [Umbelopsis vinacea]